MNFRHLCSILTLISLLLASCQAVSDENEVKINKIPFSSYDLNKDGGISKIELKRFRDSQFLVLDTNNDGYVNRPEFKKELTKGRLAQHKEEKYPSKAFVTELEELSKQVEDYFVVYDKNKDQKISRDEYEESSKEADTFLMESDTNDDQKVTEAEIKASLDSYKLKSLNALQKMLDKAQAKQKVK